MTVSSEIVVVGGSFAGIKTAWELRNRLARRHRITVLSNKPRTIFRPSFPRVIFDDVPVEDLTMDLARNFKGTGIEFSCERLVKIDQAKDTITTDKGAHRFDHLVLATGARHAYEVVPGLREHAKPLCDASRIAETKSALLDFRRGNFWAGVATGFTPADAPTMEVLMGLDHRLRRLGTRKRARLNFVSDKEKLLPPGGPTTWNYLASLFQRRGITTWLGTDVVRLDASYLHFDDGKKKPYDLCVLIPPYRGVRELEGTGLTDERGFVPVEMNTMRASRSSNGNIYAVGDASSTPAPKSGHLALMQAEVAAAHIAWRVNRKGVVPGYLPEFRFVMYLGGGESLYLYSQWMSDGDVEWARPSRQAERSKINFEKQFFALRGNTGDLHRRMAK